MEEKELLSLCQNRAPVQRIALSQFWTAEIYSFGKYIREYGFFPSSWPLCIYTDHGVGRREYPFEHELKSGAPCQFYHSPKSVEVWKKYSTKPCHVLYSPFAFYRRKNKIEKASNASGTIAFPAHTTQAIDDVSDIEIYIDQLLALPEEFQPVSVCLHMHDINKGRHKIFLKHKVPVYTAGESLDDRFVERFYSILKNFAYATSNLVGSYLYYSVEMGIPFSIYGNKQVFINKGDPNVTIGEYDPYKEYRYYRQVYDMFYGLHTEITEKQRELVETDLGLRDGVSRLKMARILYTSLFKYAVSHEGSKVILPFITSGVKRRTERLFFLNGKNVI